ncbi:MAG: Ca-activated chloride channel [Actinomycetota bacterium]|jgi:Ca-activated chloride channel family protein|nr:Ca-activated chloride channel [Actinomycetota bacterium]
MRTRFQRTVVVVVAVALAAGACSTSDGSGGGPGGGDGLQSIPKGCTAIDMQVSPEKVELLTDLARTFNSSDEAKPGGRCAFVRVQRKSSGVGMSLLVDGWPDEATNGPRPVIWSPASSAWGAILNYRLSTAGQPAMAPTDAKPFMLTPLVIAMPRPMAEAIGWPSTPIGFADILALAQDPAGWGGKGHPEWGPFRLAKTNPNFSTSGLSVTIAQYYAATGKTRDLTAEDLARPEVDAFARGVENSVVHYGDITPTFLNNWYRNDARGTSLTYTSALAVEEKSVIDYNLGNPDGITDPGEKPRPPKIPLVAIYPKEGTLFSDNPFFLLDAPWVDDREREGAQAFERYVQTPENQQRVVQFGFRPGNPAVPVVSPIDRSNGLDPDQPQNILQVPEPAVLARILDLWAQQRRSARVMLVIDVSGSMGDPADEDDDQGQTKLDLAKQAAVTALAQFKDDDDVALRIFSTEISPTEPTDYLDLVPFGPIGAQREQIASKIRSLVPTQGTPLYTVAGASFENLRASYDAAKINAVVLLTDGRNEDPRNRDLEKLLTDLHAGNEGQSSRPVRIFPIAYGQDSDLATLKRIAEATNAAAYDASNPATITQVFTAVISNF